MKHDDQSNSSSETSLQPASYRPVGEDARSQGGAVETGSIPEGHGGQQDLEPLHFEHVTMTDEEMHLLMTCKDPLAHDVFPPELVAKLEYHHEQDRLIIVERFSTIPSFQARAAKDPDFWRTFSSGLHNLKRGELENAD